MKILSVPNKENHYALWNWLAENPKKEKSQWPGFQTMIKLDIKLPVMECFACEEIDVQCFKCPLSKANACSQHRNESAYWKWNSTIIDAERTRLALIIRDAWK